MTNQINRQSKQRKSRGHYLSSDNNFYCYKRWDSDLKKEVTEMIPVDKMDPKVLEFLDESDYETDKSNRKAKDHNCPLDESKVKLHAKNPHEYRGAWEETSDPRANAEDTMCLSCGTNTLVEKVRQLIDEKFTDAQKELFYSHYGELKFLEDIRKEECYRTGKEITPQAMTNRINKMLDKIAKEFGVKRVKRHKPSEKN